MEFLKSDLIPTTPNTKTSQSRVYENYLGTQFGPTTMVITDKLQYTVAMNHTVSTYLVLCSRYLCNTRRPETMHTSAPSSPITPQCPTTTRYSSKPADTSALVTGGLHCTALHCTALHCTALHCTALHCTALH
jgi:hypothetical protein